MLFICSFCPFVVSREVEHYCTSGYKEYKKVNTYHRTSGMKIVYNSSIPTS